MVMEKIVKTLADFCERKSGMLHAAIVSIPQDVKLQKEEFFKFKPPVSCRKSFGRMWKMDGV